MADLAQEEDLTIFAKKVVYNVLNQEVIDFSWHELILIVLWGFKSPLGIVVVPDRELVLVSSLIRLFLMLKVRVDGLVLIREVRLRTRRIIVLVIQVTERSRVFRSAALVVPLLVLEERP